MTVLIPSSVRNEESTVSNIVPTAGSSPSSTGDRLPARTSRALAGIQQNAIIQAGRIQATAMVGREAMFAVADLSELEGQLAHLCPLATSRLDAIANITTLTISQRISEYRG
jgi:hypothetical protein